MVFHDGRVVQLPLLVLVDVRAARVAAHAILHDEAGDQRSTGGSAQRCLNTRKSDLVLLHPL